MKNIYILLIIAVLFGNKLFSQNVGVGTSAPGQKLDVNGWIRLGDQTAPVPPNSNTTGSIRYNTTSGTVEVNTGNTASTWVALATSAYAVPSGAILMWSGTAATIPSGWQICDGTNGTPNLLNKFILDVPAATYTSGQINQTGGNSTVTLTTTQLPAHTHTGTTDPAQPTFTGTSGQTTSSITPTFTGTPGQTTSSVTPTFTGTAGQSTSSVTPTFTGTSGQSTSAVTPTFTGTSGQSTSAVTPTFTGASGTTGAEASHTHTFSVTSGYAGDHSHYLNTTTNFSGGGTRAFYGANAGGGNDGVTNYTGGHTHTVSGTTAAGTSHTHSFTPSGSISSITHTFTATGTVSAVQPTFTASGTVSAVQPTFTASGTVSAVQPTFTATGTISTVGPLTYTATGTVSSHTHTFTTNSTGTGSSFSILPPYYTLAYIMKL